jgi:hypothetical protein
MLSALPAAARTIDWRVILDRQGNPIAFDEVFWAGQWDIGGNFIPIPLLCSLLE